MALHFPVAELQDRIARTTRRLRELGLHGMLLFRQESMYWLTGYDTAGYSQFQCLWLAASGEMMLLTRSADIRQARATSIIPDVRLWVDAAGANPAAVLRQALAGQVAAGMRLGVEYASATLNAQRGKLLDAVLADVGLEDMSDFIAELRVVKSPGELAYVRKAGRLADAAWHDGALACRPGGSESDILAAMYSAVLRGGGDPAAGRFVCGAGDNALMCRYFTGKGEIGPSDQVTVEFAAAYRHYHAALMRTVVTGRASPAQHRMNDANIAALAACRDRLRPGFTFGDLFDAHAAVLDGRGFRHARLNACGYSLGAAYPPTWMEWPMAYAGNPAQVLPGMVVFLHMILLDDTAGLAMSLGETFIVTDAEPERLSALDHSLPVVG